MHTATADHLNLAPPQPGRWLGPMGLALVVHGLLVAALTWGVGWQTDAPPSVVEAELWSRLPQQAAPRAVEPPPPPPPPEPVPQPRPPTPPPAPAPAPPPAQRQADIATAQAKKKAEDERKAREEAARKLAAEKLAADKRAAEKKAAEKAAADKAAADRAAAEKVAAEKARQQKLAEEKREQARKEAEEKREAALAAQQREDQLRRIMGQAGASGGPQATGTAQQSSGPSPGYAGRLAARIKPNVVFTEMAPGNPRAEVEVRTLPDGTITATKLVKSSGNAAWDEAVVRAIERTATLPRDTDGKVPSTLIIGLRPQD
jgi:colicin import membrane protein